MAKYFSTLKKRAVCALAIGAFAFLSVWNPAMAQNIFKTPWSAENDKILERIAGELLEARCPNWRDDEWTDYRTSRMVLRTFLVMGMDSASWDAPFQRLSNTIEKMGSLKHENISVVIVADRSTINNYFQFAVPFVGAGKTYAFINFPEEGRRFPIAFIPSVYTPLICGQAQPLQD